MYRAYEMKLLANNKKLKIIDSILIEYRRTASFIFNLYWSNFISTGEIPKLLTFNEGSMYGRTYFSSKLKEYDKKISTLCARLQRNNLRPRSSRRYRKLVDSLRAFLKNEIGRVMNRSFKRFLPKHIVVERLNFQSQRLSKRLNRIIGNFGKSIVKAKLNDLSEKYNVTIEEVNPAYTSQTCSSCDYVAKENRRSQAVFICACCGLKLHADINASRCIDARSSSSIANIYKSKAFILDKLITRFIERQASHYSLAKITQSNPYFRPYGDLIAMITKKLSNITGIV